MKKTELQKINERYARRIFWKQNKESILDFCGFVFLAFMGYVSAVVLLCL